MKPYCPRIEDDFVDRGFLSVILRKSCADREADAYLVIVAVIFGELAGSRERCDEGQWLVRFFSWLYLSDLSSTRPESGFTGLSDAVIAQACLCGAKCVSDFAGYWAVH